MEQTRKKLSSPNNRCSSSQCRWIIGNQRKIMNRVQKNNLKTKIWKSLFNRNSVCHTFTINKRGSEFIPLQVFQWDMQQKRALYQRQIQQLYSYQRQPDLGSQNDILSHRFQRNVENALHQACILVAHAPIKQQRYR